MLLGPFYALSSSSNLCKFRDANFQKRFCFSLYITFSDMLLNLHICLLAVYNRDMQKPNFQFICLFTALANFLWQLKLLNLQDNPCTSLNSEYESTRPIYQNRIKDNLSRKTFVDKVEQVFRINLSFNIFCFSQPSWSSTGHFLH